jgi:hypothetical protein
MQTQTSYLAQIDIELRQLPPERLKDVLLFVKFLEQLEDDSSLWDAVLAHQGYRQSHPDDPGEIYDSPDEFLKAKSG